MLIGLITFRATAERHARPIGATTVRDARAAERSSNVRDDRPCVSIAVIVAMAMFGVIHDQSRSRSQRR